MDRLGTDVAAAVQVRLWKRANHTNVTNVERKRWPGGLQTVELKLRPRFRASRQTHFECKAGSNAAIRNKRTRQFFKTAFLPVVQSDRFTENVKVREIETAVKAGTMSRETAMDALKALGFFA